MTDPLMTREEVADHLDIPIDQVRKVMSRAGIPHQSGWDREAVENLKRPGKGWRTDLHGAFMPTTDHLPEMFEQGLAELRRQAAEAGKQVGAYLTELMEANHQRGTDLHGPCNPDAEEN